MDNSTAKTNTKILLDIQYQVKELTSSVTALKYELNYIKSNLHKKPTSAPEISKPIIDDEVPESVQNWWWSS